MSLSERLRPDVEAAPWVIEEVKALEAEIERLREDAEAGNDWERQLLGCDKELTEAYSEIERLKKALSKCTTDIGSPWRHTGPAQRFEEINRIVAEAALDRKEATNTKPEPPPSRLIKEWRYK